MDRGDRWACFIILALIVLTRPYRARREQPPVIVKAPPPPCPWCGSRECLDSTLCNCETPCGSWLCVVKEPASG